MQFKIPNRTFLPNLIFFSFVYFLTARLGLMLATINHSVSPVWPATGLAFGILFIFGFRFWPAIAIGAFSANILNTGTFTSAFLITVGNTSQALVGTFILHYFIYRTDKFGSHNRTLGIVLASLVGSCLSATVGTTALAITGVTTWRLYRAIWFTWSAGDFLGGITILPLMLAFFSNEYSKQFDEFRKSRIKLTSIAALIVSGIFLCWIVFFRPDGTPYLFLLFPLLLCCVGMAGERGVTIATILISIVGIVSVQLGFGVFIHGSTNVNLINLQLFLGSVGISSLIMSDLKRVSSLRQPAIILLFSWLIAGIFFFTLYNRSIEETNKHFQVVVDSVGPMLEARMKFYFSPLQSETALFAASQKVTHLEWKQYLNYSDYFNQLPGVEGFGVVFRVYKKDLQHFIKARKVEGLNKFKYHLLPNISKKDLQKTNDSLESFVVTYIEPYEKNILKAGLDMYSESNRRIAAEIARDTGLPTITSKIFLLDDPKKRPAFLAYSPLYTKGPVPKTINERRARILGWVYATVIYRDFFDSIFLHKNYKELSYSVTEANNESSTPLVASSTDYDKLPKSDIESRSINVGNHNFILNFKRSAAFISKQDNFSSWTGVTASILSLLIGTFIVSLQSVKKSAIDLANRKTMDLKASEELWKFALEGAGDGVWDMDIPSKKVFTSKRFNELLGYAAVETTYKIDEIQKIVHPEDLSRLLTELLNHLSGKIPNFAIEFRLRSIDGSYIWFLDRGMIVSRDQDNLPVRMVGTIADISTQKEAEHRLESQRAKLHSIFEGTNDAIMLIDKNGHFFDCNKQTLKLFGLESKEELKSLNPADLSPLFQPDGTHSLKKANEKIQKAFESGINQFEWTHKRKNGEEFLTEVLLSAFTFESKRIIQATIRDISERKNIEESLRAEREKLMASAKMSSLGEMAGGIAHEINNPLAIIIGKISQLKRRIKTGSEEIVIAKFNEDLSLIENTAKRIGLIIKGLSAFSRNAENDSMEEVLVPVLIQDMLELSKERFKFKSVDLRFDVANCQQVFVLGRASQLLQVLINLLNNAFDAVEELPERWVEIQVKIVVNKCHIIITDSGTGIPPELVEKIMSPFFTTKSLGKGTGLGLSISKGIIEEHHGKLYYDSTSKNTRFVIELPIA